MSRARALSLVPITLAFIALAIFGVRWVVDTGERSTGVQVATVSPDESADYDYVIPFGTAAKIAAGDNVSIMPTELEVHVGETIRIVNNDRQGHMVGPFYVGADETMAQRFSSPGELSGECTVDPGGEFVLRVLP